MQRGPREVRLAVWRLGGGVRVVVVADDGAVRAPGRRPRPASEIENFKLYGSPDNSSWTELLHQSTSANITSSGSDFTITNPGSYQHYGLVVTKNTGYHNVSLGEIKLGVTESVSEYYKLADWKTLIAGCADFAAFKTAVAAL